jgi:hypothetical protein
MGSLIGKKVFAFQYNIYMRAPKSGKANLDKKMAYAKQAYHIV